MTPLGYQQIFNPHAATGLSPPVGATLAQIAVSNAPIRWRDDGTSPTTLLGIPVVDDQQFTYDGNLSAIQFINMTSQPATIDVSYYK